MASSKIATSRACQDDVAAKMHEKLVAQDINAPKALSKRAWKAATEAIIELLQEGNDVELIGVGTLSLRKREAYVGRNPRTGEPAPVAAKVSVGFIPSSVLKKALNSAGK